MEIVIRGVRVAGAIVAGAFALLLAWAGPAQAAGGCSLTGSGREGATDTTVYQVPGPTLKASMLFVDFPDHPAAGGETPPQSTIGADLVTRAVDYMAEVSNGDTELDVQMGTTWLRMGGNASSYDWSTFNGQRAYMLEAVQLADAAGFDFSERQTLYVVAADTGGELPLSAAFHASSGFGMQTDGTNIRWGTTMGDDSRFSDPRWPDYGSKVLSHETAHTFGLPDLYRYSGVASFETTHLDVGAWDPMGWVGPGLHLFGWHKQKLGWLDQSDWICVDGQATATLTPLAAPGGGTKMLVSKTAPGIAYVAEVRTPTWGFESEMCDPGGVLIYRVNADGGNGSLNGAAPITVMPANPDDPGDPSGNCAALSNAPFGFGAGEVSTFTAGPVTVEVLGGNLGAGFSVRMTGPRQEPTRLGTAGGRVNLIGVRSARALLRCPAGGGLCAGRLTLRLGGRRGRLLGSAKYSVPSGKRTKLKLPIKRGARTPLRRKLSKGNILAATAILAGSPGRTFTPVRLVG